jgi:hypothetical protein
MAGSLHGLSQQSAMLPVPRILLSNPLKSGGARNPNGIDYTLAKDGQKLFMRSMPLFTAIEIPEALFAMDLRLELVRYSSRHHNNAKPRGHDGYKHPTHNNTDGAGWNSHCGATPVATNLPNSKFRGGLNAEASRSITEWSVTSSTQSFLIDTLGDFYTLDNILYRDTSGNNQFITMYVPSDRSANGGQTARGTFGYSARHRPNYFKFRFSVADPSNDRQRITGAETDTFVMAPYVHPFVQDVVSSQAFQQTNISIDPNFSPTVFNVWLRTRLPGGVL